MLLAHMKTIQYHKLEYQTSRVGRLETALFDCSVATTGSTKAAYLGPFSIAVVPLVESDLHYSTI
jgi:hypothetical protein